jgi:hypothetical protein
MITDKVAQQYHGGRTVSLIKGRRKTGIHMQKKKVGSFPYTIYKSNSKWIKNKA